MFLAQLSQQCDTYHIIFALSAPTSPETVTVAAIPLTETVKVLTLSSKDQDAQSEHTSVRTY